MKCNTDNFVPLVVRGLFTSFGRNSSSASPPQDSSSSSSSSALERSDEIAPQVVQINSQLSCWRTSQNLEDKEVLASAHRSQDSVSERPAKVVSK